MLAACLASFLSLPAAAQAETFCVRKPKCVQAGGTPHMTIGGAMAAAGANGNGVDRIEVGPGVHEEWPSTAGHGNPVVIVGAGMKRTTLKLASDADHLTVLTLLDPSSRVQGLSVRLGGGAHQSGITSSGVVKSVRAIGNADVRQAGVTLLVGGRIERSEIIIRGSHPDSLGLDISSEGTIAREVKVRAPIGVLGGLGSRLVRSTVSATTVGVRVSSGSFAVDNALVRALGGAHGAQALAESPGAAAQLTVVSSTIVAQKRAGTGVEARAFAVADMGCPRADVVLRNSIVHGFATTLFSNAPNGFCTGGSGEPEGNITVSWSALKAKGKKEIGGGGIRIGRGVTGTNLRFVAPKKGNYRLRRSSRLIDRGQPGKPKPGESKRDLDGRKRVIDGDGKGGPRRDIGAYEFKSKKKKTKKRKRGR